MKLRFNFEQYGRLIAVVAVSLVAGLFVLIHQHSSASLSSGCSPNNESACGYAGSTNSSTSTSAQKQTTAPPITTPTSSSTPQQSPSVKTGPWTVDNSQKCSTIAATGNANLATLQAQIVQQLQIMKAIIGNSSIDNEILSYGGSVNQIISQGEITESFNQADTNATNLIDQYSSAKSNLTDQLTGLNNGSSPGCVSALKPLLGL